MPVQGQASLGAVVLAVYRPEAELFRRQVQSIRDQSLADWTCAIGLDGPDPAARELATSLTAGDPRFTVREFPERVGVYRHFERLLELVPPDAEWVALADQDDYWYPEKLQVLVDRLSADPGLCAVTTQARVVGEDGRVFGVTRRNPGRLSDLLLNNSMSGAMMLFRRESLDMALPFPEPTNAAYHDHWVAACCAALGTLEATAEPLQDYVQHGGNVVGEKYGETMTQKFQRLGRAAGEGSRLHYLAFDRWGWRVTMAQNLLIRSANADVPERSVVSAIATSRPLRRLAVAVFSCIGRRRIGVAEGLGLLVGAVWWRWGSRSA